MEQAVLYKRLRSEFTGLQKQLATAGLGSFRGPTPTAGEETGNPRGIDEDKLWSALRGAVDEDKLWSLLESAIKQSDLPAILGPIQDEGIPALALLHFVSQSKTKSLLEALLDKDGILPVLDLVKSSGIPPAALLSMIDRDKLQAACLPKRGGIREGTKGLESVIAQFVGKGKAELGHDDFRDRVGAFILAIVGTYRRDAAFLAARDEVAFPTVFEWVLSEIAKSPRRLLDFYAAANPERVVGFNAIIGDCDAMSQAKLYAARAAENEYGVILLGESGTGKELFSQAIHASGSRRDGPFVPINCAAIPHDVFESEMFGHEKGAFTGAVAKRDGAFKRAHGGTLFLDEIGECRLDDQTKLLRVLQSTSDSCNLKFLPVGADKEENVDVRVIAGTNQNLLKMSRENRFRSDLYYRLNTLVINLPPLRQRGESDLRRLVDFFWGRINNELSRHGSNSRPKTLDKSAYARLLRHSWPGNVRELDSVLKRAAVWHLGNVIDGTVIDAVIDKDEMPGPFQRERGSNFKLDERLDEIERIYVEDALKECGGRKAKAVRSLGLNSPAALDRKLEKIEKMKKLEVMQSESSQDLASEGVNQARERIKSLGFVPQDRQPDNKKPKKPASRRAPRRSKQ